MRRGILPAEGSRILALTKTRCRKRPLVTRPSWPTLAKRVRGKKIQSIGRHGKRLLLELDSQDTLVIEPRMTGLVLLDEPPTQDHVRFQVKLENAQCPHVQYWDRRGLGQIHLLDTSQRSAFFDRKRIGPDALAITPAELRERLCQRQIAVKVGLLDQKAVAGIGNIYASEILHLAKVDPRRRCLDISSPEWKRIYGKMQQVLEKAIELEGSTLGDGTYRNALNHPAAIKTIIVFMIVTV